MVEAYDIPLTYTLGWSDVKPYVQLSALGVLPQASAPWLRCMFPPEYSVKTGCLVKGSD